MRNLFYPAVALVCILLIAVSALVLWPDSFLPQWHHSLAAFLRPSSSENKPSPSPAPTAEKKTAVKKPAGSSHPSTVPVMEAAVEPVPVPAGALSSPARQYPFPVAEQIPAGTPLATVIGQFGRPEMKATGADKGELRERYVYVDRLTGRRTFIAVVNSIVTSAQTLTQ